MVSRLWRDERRPPISELGARRASSLSPSRWDGREKRKDCIRWIEMKMGRGAERLFNNSPAKHFLTVIKYRRLAGGNGAFGLFEYQLAVLIKDGFF